MYVTTGLGGGGAERLLTTIVLQRQAVEAVSVVSLLPGGPFRPVLEAAGVPVSDLGMNGPRDAVSGLRALATKIRDERPSVIYGWMYHGNLAALAARRIAGTPQTPLFWTIFCTDSLGPQRRPGARVLRRACGWLSRYVDGVIYNSVTARAFHQHLGFRERHSVVLGNVIDPRLFHRDVEGRQALRTEIGVGEDDVLVATIARVDAMKDWRTVQQAVSGLPGVVTVAVGEGTDALPPQPGFRGLGWRGDVQRILNAADVFLIGSAFGEGSSLALGEAMLCGLPCVVTDVGDNAAVAGDGGIVVAPRCPASIRSAIEQLVADPARRDALGRAARARGLAALSRPDTFANLRAYSLGEGH